MICAVPNWRLLMLLAALSFLSLPAWSGEETSTPGSTSEARPTAGTVTIEAGRERELKRQISKFVSGAVFTYLNDSLERWDTPICPLVAGLPQERGEFILARVSQIARDSHAPLGPEHCRPNLYIVVTDNPDLLLEKWTRRDRHMFNTCNGRGYVEEFLHSRQAVRAFYNARFTSDAGERDASILELDGLSLELSFNPCIAPGVAGTRLRFGAVQKLTSVIIVVDTRRTANRTMGQLADYVALVGLAQVRSDADPGTAPTILRVFAATDPQPAGLTRWDQAFLQSLYDTSQDSVLEVSRIKRRMFAQISGQ